MAQIALFIFIGFLSTAIATGSETGLRLLFPIPNRQYVYELKTNVSTSTQPVSNKSSLWLLEGVVTIQCFDNFAKARLHLDVRRKTLIGNNGNYDFYELEGDKFLKNPWELDYQDNGFIKSIYVSEEPTWCVNLKRAISVNFQLTRNTGASSTYSMNEPCLDEICVMVYTIRGNSIRKYTSFRVPTARSSYSWGSVPWNVEYAGLLYVDSIAASERNYEMDSQKGLITLDLKGSYQYKTHDHLLSVTSDLYMNFKEDIPAISIEKLNLSQTTIQYVAGDFSDPTNGIANFTQFHLANKSYNILLKIARKGIDADNIVRNASLIHNLDFIELLNTMSQLNYESLIKLFNDLVLGTSYDMETSRNIFLEILPHLRSDACARFIKYTVLEEKEKVEDVALLSLIRKLPFNIATHSQKLLEELEVFTKLSLDFSQDIRHAGILSFATLAHNTMAVSQVKQDYFENIVVKYFRMYSDCPRYLDRMVWLQGLCNIGYSAEAYTRIIYADSGRNKHERLWAALAGSPKTEAPYMVLETTLPVLTNDTEDIQLRIVALHMFLSSQNVRETDFLFVHNYILNCQNKHLKRFWFSTVKNMALNRDFTGYRIASFYIPFISNQVPHPTSQDWATNNYIISGTQEDGAPSMQVLSIGDDLGALPGFVGLKLYTGGRRPYKAALYVIAEGVVANIKDYRRMYQIDPQDINAEKLLAILQTVKTWGLKKAEKLHIDIVVKIHDKTVFATHMNQTRFEKWNVDDFAYIVDFLRFGSHINQQIVYYPFQTDVHLSTEIGTPIRLQSTILSFTSIRGNITAPTSDEITWKNDLHIRYQATAVTTLATAAPLLQTVHVARIQQSLVAHVPAKFNISLSNTIEEIVLTWPNPGDQQAGVAMHSRAEVTTETKTEGYDFMMKKGGIENRKDSIFFDCERPMTGAEVLNKLLASNTKHQDFFHSIQPSLVILNGVVLFSSPPSGSCGVIIQPRVTGSNDVLQVSVTLDRLKYNDVLQVGARCRIKYYSLEDPSHELMEVEAGAKYQKIDGHGNLELKAHGHHSTTGDSSNQDWMVCLNGSETIDSSFLKDTSNTPARFDGSLTLAFHQHQNSCSEASESQLLVQYRGEPEPDGEEFRVKILGRNLTKMGVLEKMDWISQTPWGQLMKTNNGDPLNVTAVIKERLGLTTVRVNDSPEMTLRLETFSWLMDRWTDTQIKKNFGFYRECRLQGQDIAAFSGDTKQLPNSQCEADLLAADCSDNKPRFAVFRVGNGVKVYSGGYYIHVRDNDGNIVVDDTHSEGKLGITQKEEMYKITTKSSNILVYYRRDDIVVLVPRLYISTLCGICVDVNEFNVC